MGDMDVLLLLLLLQALVQDLYKCLDRSNAVDTSAAAKLSNLQSICFITSALR
jgi:hypothetical protein